MVVESSSIGADGKLRIQIALDNFEQTGGAEKILKEIVDSVAKEYVEKFGNEIMSKFDQQAIANLVLASIAKKVADEYLKPKA